MALPRLTFARVKSARKVGDTTLLDIAVQTEGGEVSPGEIVAGGFVTGDSLIFGAMVGDKFVPWRNGTARSSATAIYARITGATQVGYGKWEYDWVEVEPGDGRGTYNDVEGGRNSAADGPIRNGMETPNEADEVQGSGIDAANLPPGFNPVPIGVGAVPEIKGPYGSASDPWWRMSVSTHVDGLCGGGA